jgi:hypothetical protein
MSGLASAVSAQVILQNVRAIAPGIRDRARTAEQERRLPQVSVDELLHAGVARMLVPASTEGLTSRWMTGSTSPRR